MEPQGNSVFSRTLYFQGKGAYTLTFVALDKDGNERCSGSIGLEALGPRPASAAMRISRGAWSAGARE